MRLLKALLNGKPPPEEEDGEEEEDDDEAYPVNESGAKQEAAPAKAEEAGAAKAAPAAEAAQEAELTTKLQTLSFSTAGELSIASPEPEAEPFTLPRPSWASLPLQPTSTPYPYPYPYPYPHPAQHAGGRDRLPAGRLVAGRGRVRARRERGARVLRQRRVGDGRARAGGEAAQVHHHGRLRLHRPPPELTRTPRGLRTVRTGHATPPLAFCAYQRRGPCWVRSARLGRTVRAAYRGT